MQRTYKYLTYDLHLLAIATWSNFIGSTRSLWSTQRWYTWMETYKCLTTSTTSSMCRMASSMPLWTASARRPGVPPFNTRLGTANSAPSECHGPRSSARPRRCTSTRACSCMSPISRLTLTCWRLSKSLLPPHLLSRYTKSLINCFQFKRANLHYEIVRI